MSEELGAKKVRLDFPPCCATTHGAGWELAQWAGQYWYREDGTFDLYNNCTPEQYAAMRVLQEECEDC